MCVEIGPGPGGLTRALLGSDAASVTVVELDRRAVGGDARSWRRGWTGGCAWSPPMRWRWTSPALVPAPRQVVANLPYNIATPLLIGWLRQAAAFERLTLMFQQEVARADLRRARTRRPMGGCPCWRSGPAATDLLLRIPPAAFVPPPKVFSAVVGLVPHAAQPEPALFATMERLTAAAFGQRRKMLRGALKALGGEALLRVRASRRIGGRRRCTVAEFDRLARLISLRGGALAASE